MRISVSIDAAVEALRGEVSTEVLEALVAPDRRAVAAEHNRDQRPGKRNQEISVAICR